MSDRPQVVLSGFGDEAANQKTAVEQFAAFAALGLQYYSLRFVDVGGGVKNVMKLTKSEITKLRHLEDEYGMNVASIGSPLGKVKLRDVDDGTKNQFVPFDKYLEKEVTRACELARDERRALVVCSASGGARQHEGVIALLQMAKTAAAVRALSRARTPFVSVLTDPTLAGVTASFAALGDCIIAEPGAVIGFAGPRIIEQATGERLPPGADTAEFQLPHGMVDMVVPRRELRDAVVKVIRLYQDAVNLTRPHAVQRPAAELDTVVAAG